MTNVSYGIGCRNCIQGDGARHSYIYQGSVEDFDGRPEIYLVDIIEKWRAKDGHVCQFCSSKNIEVFNVELDGRKVYDYYAIHERQKAHRGYILY